MSFLLVIATLSLILGAVRTLHVLRARGMRHLAARWGFRYIGPSAPPKWWWNPSHVEIRPPVPNWVASFRPSGQRIRQIWNVIEGQRNEVAILIFDTVVGEYRGGQPCTIIACRTKENPFGIVSKADRVVQSHGWTVLHGVSFLWFSWMMSTKRIDSHIDSLRPDQGWEADKAQRPERSALET